MSRCFPFCHQMNEVIPMPYKLRPPAFQYHSCLSAEAKSRPDYGRTSYACAHKETSNT